MTTETRSDFAKRLGVHKSTVTRLAAAGRIVLTEDDLVDVEQSLALIEQTKGRRDDVAARHAAQRAAVMSEPQPTDENATAARNPATADATAPQQAVMNDAARAKALAESRRVIAQADKEEMERDRIAGNLVAREDVDAAMKFIGATVRSLLDVLPDQVAPLVAPVSDLAEVQQLLGEACRNVLVGLGEAIKRQQAALAEEGEA